jgi:hypothetical protein
LSDLSEEEEEEEEEEKSDKATPVHLVKPSQPPVPFAPDADESASPASSPLRPPVPFPKNDKVSSPVVLSVAHDVSRSDIEAERERRRQVQAQRRPTLELLQEVLLEQSAALSFSDAKENPAPTVIRLSEEDRLASSRLPEPGSFQEAPSSEGPVFVEKEGFLVKLAENPSKFSFRGKTAHSRYFRLSAGVLAHSKSKESKIPRGVVNLEDATVEFIRCEGLHQGYCVAVKAAQRNYTLFPQSKQDAVEWVVALERYVVVFSLGFCLLWFFLCGKVPHNLQLFFGSMPNHILKMLVIYVTALSEPVSLVRAALERYVACFR